MSPRKSLVMEAKKHAEQSKKKEGAFGHCHTAGLVELGLVNSSASADEWHRLCRGSAPAKGGRLSLCGCDCHATRCRDCGTEGTELTTDTGVCADRQGCADTLLARLRTPEREKLRKDLSECREEGERVRAAARADKAARALRAAEQEGRAVSADEEAAPTPSTASAPRRTGQRCHCGCGGMTKGGQFVMGHDMKLKGRLYEVAREPKTKKAPPNAHPLDERIAATAEILARGWNEMGIPDRIRKSALKGDWDTAPDVVIDTRVKERYGDQ